MKSMLKVISIGFIFFLVNTGCRTANPKVKNTAELASLKSAHGMPIDTWCHFKRETANKEKIAFDFKIQRRKGIESLEDFVVEPLTVSVQHAKLQKSNEVRADISRMEYFYEHGPNRAEQNGQWRISMSFESAASKFSGKASDPISVLSVKGGVKRYAAYTDISLRVNGKFLVDKETQRDEIKVNFIEIASNKANCD